MHDTSPTSSIILSWIRAPIYSTNTNLDVSVALKNTLAPLAECCYIVPEKRNCQPSPIQEPNSLSLRIEHVMFTIFYRTRLSLITLFSSRLKSGSFGFPALPSLVCLWMQFLLLIDWLAGLNNLGSTVSLGNGLNHQGYLFPASARIFRSDGCAIVADDRRRIGSLWKQPGQIKIWKQLLS